jgi:acetylornithine deacetylase/succinyl-diaminopimelate desuccinylase-like protein
MGKIFLIGKLTLLLCAFCSVGPASAKSEPQQEPAVAKVLTSSAYRRASLHLEQNHDQLVRDIIAITQTPAPTFQEAERATLYKSMLEQAGLENVEIDPAGNVIALRRGSSRGPIVVVSAHLDTVFPAGTDVTVKRSGTRLAAPGISDDSRGLAVLLAYARALDAAQVRTRNDIIFLATVGEEGAGNSRGVRAFFTEGKYKDRVRAFISVDGINPAEVTNGGTGSVRYRIVFKGPGGHSYRAFGSVTPVAAMAKAIDEFYRTSVPNDPKTTYAVGVISGGTSVNSIPSEAMMEVDLRSVNAAELDKLDRHLQAVVQKAVAEENRTRGIDNGKITVDMNLIGRRPTGLTKKSHPLVVNMVTAATAAEYKPWLETRSTDANFPMSLGIPSIAIGSGGSGGRMHSPDEFIDVEPKESVRGMRVGLAALIATANAQ